MKRFLLGIVCPAVSLVAQSFYIPTNTPTLGTCNAAPFATGADTRYQTLITAASLNNTPALILGFGLAPCAPAGVRTFARLTMKMAHTTSATLSTTFASNLGAGLATVLDIPSYKWIQVPDTWNDVDLQLPFFYNGVDNLVVEFTVLGASGTSGVMHRDGTNQRVYTYPYTGQATATINDSAAFKMRLITGDASVWTFGAGCVGSNSQTPALSFSGAGKLGTTLTVQLAGAFAPTATALHLGTTSSAPVFPFDLTPIGGVGCTIYHDVLVAIGTGTTTGSAALPLAIPNAAGLVGYKAYFQWVVLDVAANALGVTTSNYGRALIGN
jgi:hypothetical protein